MTAIDTTLPDEAATSALGAVLANVVATGFAEPHDPSFDGFTIHLSGPLGAGKTTVVRALLRALGVEGRIKSPTYTLVEPYVVEMPHSRRFALESRRDMKLDCYHFDFYRFEDPHEWLSAGFRDYFADAALRLVEWPERAVGDDGSLLPAPDVRVTLSEAGSGRFARVAAETERGRAWLTRTPLAASGGASSPAG